MVNNVTHYVVVPVMWVIVAMPLIVVACIMVMTLFGEGGTCQQRYR
jgi:hypothetical protein